MRIRPALLAIAIATFHASATAAPPVLTELWSTPGFANPESVLLSPGGDFLYVSNVAGEGDARDGNGFISRVSLDGKILEREWAKGLDAPKGLVISGERLYATDISSLAEIDLSNGKVIAKHAAKDAAFLNDAALAPDKTILVSDSGKARIYGWRDGVMQVWLEHEQLKSINGLLPEPGRLLVTTMAGKFLAVDWKTKQISELATELGNADGVVALGKSNYFIGEWPGRLFHVKANGKSSVLIDSRKEKRYLNDFLLLGDRLLIPNWEPSTLTAYSLTP